MRGTATMPIVTFAPAIQRHVALPPTQTRGQTLREALDEALAQAEHLRGYVLDEQGALREHIAVFVGGKLAEDRRTLRDPVSPETEIHVFQALSGG